MQYGLKICFWNTAKPTILQQPTGKRWRYSYLKIYGLKERLDTLDLFLRFMHADVSESYGELL